MSVAVLCSKYPENVTSEGVAKGVRSVPEGAVASMMTSACASLRTTLSLANGNAVDVLPPSRPIKQWYFRGKCI